ncbi:glycosyltransferase [Algoriphagus confluentis]|uniref:Glycosyltransferase 2-like domain-containing protein n=1 Tax=Algoriphagus confluentis TaxID=1697556 RepID=A0ABQ6PXS0_9BACT|nr:hypothetical protein Aconfl_41970 [Algoriphagus confluentis]
MSNPLISIALCTYQGERFLARQLDSLLAQTYRPIEIVIQDDCSTDQTWEIVEAYKRKFPDIIRSFRNKIQLGIRSNFESVFQKCQGELIAPCDQDDIWDFSKLEEMSSRIGDHILIYHDSALVDESGVSLGRRVSEKFQFAKGSDPAKLLLMNCVSGHSILFKKQLLAHAHPFPAKGYYDHWLAFTAMCFGTVDYLDKTLVLFRQHRNNYSSFTKMKRHRSNHSIRKMEQENYWLYTCKKVLGDHPSTSAEIQLIEHAQRRESQFFSPRLGWLIWKNRGRFLYLIPGTSLRKFFFALRYCFGLKIKRLKFFRL